MMVNGEQRRDPVVTTRRLARTSVLHGGGMSLSLPYPCQGFMRRGRNAGVPGPSFGSGH